MLRRPVAAVLLLACLAACDDDPSSGWHRGADSPLSPRWGAIVGWTGTEMLVVGGTTTTPSNPGADGAATVERFAADGAAYDPSADTWRPLPVAPVGLRYFYRSTMSGDTLVVFAPRSKGDAITHRWLAYSAGSDAWRTLPDPPQPARDPGSLSSFGSQVYVLDADRRVMVLDLDGDTWKQLPASQATPAISGDTVVGTAIGPVVTGDAGGSSARRAEVWQHGAWRRLPDLLPGGLYWHWTGRRLVDPDLQVGGGGDQAGGILDVTDGSYSKLPHAPDEERFLGGARGEGAAGPLMVSFGYLYDDDHGTWTALPLLSETLNYASGVIAGDRLVLFGGFDTKNGYEDNEAGLSNAVWVRDLTAS